MTALTPPIVLPPVYEAAAAVQVCGERGARVEVVQAGKVVGQGTTGRGQTATVEITEVLVAGTPLTARQRVGEDTSRESEPVEVREPTTLHEPRIVGPVADDDRHVWVSGVTPGARVSVTSRGTEVGSAPAGEPLVSVRVEPVADTVQAHVRLGDLERSSKPVPAVVYPGEPGPHGGYDERDVDYGSHDVPPLPDSDGPDGGFTVRLRGRVYVPAREDGDVADSVRGRPLVLVAHGFHTDPESFKGYGWLGAHLARWGALVCSVDLDEVNLHTGSGNSAQQWARGEVLLAMLDALADDADIGPLVDGRAVGLVGHSMSGEGVVAAQELNRRRRTPYGIRGIVSLAPTNHEPGIASTHAAYLQLHGSLDGLLFHPEDVTGEEARFGGFRLYDRAWRHRTLGWLEGAGHDEWNDVWISPGPLDHERDAVRLGPDRQQDIGRQAITAFFLDALFDQPAYRGYFSGPARLRDPAGSLLLLQHQSGSVEVIDDFGDGDEQLGLDPQPPDETVNRRGEPVEARGEGLDIWEEREHVTLARSVHDTRGVDLAWSQRDVVYSSGLDAPQVSPRGVLSLRVAQHYVEDDAGDPDETWNAVGRDLDLLVDLDDGRSRATVRLGSARLVSYPLPGGRVYSVFQTVRLPLDAFSAVNPALDLATLERVRLRPALHDTGRLLLDDLEFVTPLVTEPTRVRMLRAHERGGYGPVLDHLDAHVVVQATTRPDETFGFRLRADEGLPAAEDMLATLRRALAADQPVRLVYRRAGPSVRWLLAVDGVHRAD